MKVSITLGSHAVHCSYGATDDTVHSLRNRRFEIFLEAFIVLIEFLTAKQASFRAVWHFAAGRTYRPTPSVAFLPSNLYRRVLPVLFLIRWRFVLAVFAQKSVFTIPAFIPIAFRFGIKLLHQVLSSRQFFFLALVTRAPARSTAVPFLPSSDLPAPRRRLAVRLAALQLPPSSIRRNDSDKHAFLFFPSTDAITLGSPMKCRAIGLCPCLCVDVIRPDAPHFCAASFRENTSLVHRMAVMWSRTSLSITRPTVLYPDMFANWQR